MAFRMNDAPIRVTVLTGFLGAGKTTLLNRLLAEPDLAGTAVIVNEFGDVGIDHLLVETASEGLIELSGGCLCCSVRGDLADTLADLADRMQTGRIAPLKRVAIETTGLADPTPILALLMGHPVLAQAYAPGGVVTVVDALAGADNLAGLIEARRQVALADRIVVTKTDLADAGSIAALRERLGELNPTAPCLDAMQGEATSDLLLRGDAFGAREWVAERAGGHGHPGHHHHHHTGGIGSVSIVHETPLPEEAAAGFFRMLVGEGGARLLRVKGIVRTVENPRHPLVVHGVRGFLHPPERLPAWPAGLDPSTRIVMIGEDLNERRLRDLFAAFAGEARIDVPDRAALTDNPLAPPGFTLAPR